MQYPYLQKFSIKKIVNFLSLTVKIGNKGFGKPVFTVKVFFFLSFNVPDYKSNIQIFGFNSNMERYSKPSIPSFQQEKTYQVENDDIYGPFRELRQ